MKNIWTFLRNNDYYATREISIKLEPPSKEFDYDSDEEHKNHNLKKDDGTHLKNYGCEIGPFCIFILVSTIIVRAWMLLEPILKPSDDFISYKLNIEPRHIDPKELYKSYNLNNFNDSWNFGVGIKGSEKFSEKYRPFNLLDNDYI